MSKEVCKLCNIYISSLITGAILGSTVFCDVKLYQGKKEFLADESNHKRAFEAETDEFRDREPQI